MQILGIVFGSSINCGLLDFYLQLFVPLCSCNMVNYIKQLYKKSLLIGLPKATEFKEKVKIELSNQFIFIGLTCVFVHNILNLFFLQSFTDFCLTMVWFVVLFPALLLNIAGKTSLARMFIAYCGIFSVFTLHLLFGAALKLESFYILFLVVATLFFEFSLMRKYALMVIVLFFLATVINAYSAPMFADLVRPSGAFTRFIFSVILISSLVGKLIQENRLYNTVISNQNEQLQFNKQELELTNKELTKSNKELERFVYIASHDLKTPLLNIVSFAKLLEGKLKSSDDESIHEYLSFIKSGGERLQNLISDTLEYSKLSNGKYELKAELVDLNFLLTEIQESISLFIAEKNAKVIKLKQLPVVKAPHAYLVLLFQNLIENGIKYNKSEKPTIKIKSSRDATFFSIFIEDNGIGIAEEFQDKVFVMYSRLHNQNKYAGSGLGLSTCKKIITQLNGDILLQSNVGKGSVFEIQFPLEIVVPQNQAALA